MADVIDKSAPATAAAQPRAALDLQGVASIGLDAWRATYRWPVTDAEYDALVAAFQDTLLGIGADLPPREQDLLLADSGLPGFLLQHMHIKAAGARLAAANHEPVSGSIVAPYLAPDWMAQGQAGAVGLSPAPRLRSALREAGKAWLLNNAVSPWRRVTAMAGRTPVWALGSRTPLRAAYIAHHRLACRYVTPDLFAGPTLAISPLLEDAVKRHVERASEAAQRILQVSFDQAAAVSAWIARLSHINAVAHNVERSSHLPETLLLTDIGLPANRTIARTMRRRGTRVVGFHHGNDMGVQPSPTSTMVDLLPVDTFVVPSSACLRWRRAQYQASKLASLHAVDFERLPTPTYSTWLEQGMAAALPATVSKVMIVGFPPNWIRYGWHAAHWGLSQLDVEVALIETLQAAGYTVLYKAHPEWEAQLKPLFAGLGCRFVGGHFEDCWQEADAFVFPRTSSTSFGFALCTNRPIVLLDVREQDWVGEARELLMRRCRPVPATVDNGLRVRFDAAALLAALAAPVAAPDQRYVREAMCA